MIFSKDTHFYFRIDARIYRVVAVAVGDQEANDLLANHHDLAVLAVRGTDADTALVFLAKANDHGIPAVFMDPP